MTVTKGLKVAWAGFALQLAGNQWDQQWHSTHGMRMEGGGDLLYAHGLLYLGVAVLLSGAALLPRARPAAGAVAAGAALVLVGAAVQALGYAIDGWHHFNGSESDLGHFLAFIGQTLALPGLIITSVAQRRSTRRGRIATR